MNHESFPNEEFSNGFFYTNEAQTVKVFPTFGLNPLNHEIFLSLKFCCLWYSLIIPSLNYVTC